MTVVLVTGASRGLGLEVSVRLAREGKRVLMAMREPARADAMMAELRGERLDVVAVPLDVSRDDAGSVALAHVREHGGALDVLVNNAGIALDGFDADVVRETLRVNVGGVQRVTSALAPTMPAGGRIVMVSSGMGELSCLGSELRRRFARDDLTATELEALLAELAADVAAGRHVARGWPTSAYRVSKAALGALTRIYAREHPELRVNAVCPGWVRTDMGGPGATRSIAEGATSILWATHVPADGPTGGFFRDGHAIRW